MIINKSLVKKVAKRFLRFLDEREINSASNLDKIIGQRFIFEDISPACIEVSLRPSNYRTAAYTISYVSPFFEETPLVVKINPALDYSLIIVKMNRVLINYNEHYKEFGVNGEANIKQNKVIESSDIFYVKEELRSLARI